MSSLLAPPPPISFTNTLSTLLDSPVLYIFSFEEVFFFLQVFNIQKNDAIEVTWCMHHTISFLLVYFLKAHSKFDMSLELVFYPSTFKVGHLNAPSRPSVPSIGGRVYDNVIA